MEITCRTWRAKSGIVLIKGFVLDLNSLSEHENLMKSLFCGSNYSLNLAKAVSKAASYLCRESVEKVHLPELWQNKEARPSHFYCR